MSTQKAMSAREYRALAEQKRSEQPTQLVTMPSGFVWELRIPDLEGDVLVGRIPQSLVSAGMKAWKAQGKAPASEVKSEDEDAIEGLIYMRETVRKAAVNPRIVMGAAKDDEIDPADILPGDFKFIFNWCMSHGGVRGVTGLETFRKGRKRGTARTRTNGKKLRAEAIPVGQD